MSTEVFSGADVVRIVLVRELTRILAFDPLVRKDLEAESIHQMRVGARRLRSELAILEPALKKQFSDSVIPSLKWLGEVLGKRRDLDVLSGILLRDMKLDEDDPVLGEMARNTKMAERKINQALNTKRYRKLISEISQGVIDPQVRSRSKLPASDLLGPGFHSAVDRLFASGRSNDQNATNLELHHLRILTKRTRYSVEVAKIYNPGAFDAFSNSLSELQDVLGDLHDRVLALSLFDSGSQSKEFPLTRDQEQTRADGTTRVNQEIVDLRQQWEPLLVAAKTEFDRSRI